VVAAENDSFSADEATLRSAHVGTDGPSLLRYLRQRVPKEESSDRTAALIRQLGHDSFSVREEATKQLMLVGAAAVPSLRQAAADPDPEIRRRAQWCLQQIARIPDGMLAGAIVTPIAVFRFQPGGLETLIAYWSVCDSLERAGNPSAIIAGVRLLSVRRPAGAAQVLLDYLPFVVDDSIREEIDNALTALALRKGVPDPDLMRALQAKLASRRAVAALALCRAGSLPMARRVRPLLQDPDAEVRQRVATVLAELCDPEAMPVLISLLDRLALTEAQQADEALRQVAGELAPAVTPGGQTAESWRKSRESWEIWWRGLDGRKLLQLFQRRTPSDDDLERMLALARALGDDDFEVRQQASARLQLLGPLALPVLRRALEDSDPEVVQRAQICKEQIEKSWRPLVCSGVAKAIGLGAGEPWLLAGFLHSIHQIEKNPGAAIPNGAARLVGMRSPPGAADALLAYVPFAEDDMEIEEIQSALTTLDYLGGPADAVLVRALDDKNALRRGVAAVALCRARGVHGAPEAVRLLHDRDPLVRLRLGLALADLKDKDVIPGLVDLLAELPEEQAWPVEDLLRRLAGDQAPQDVATSDSSARQKWRDTWAAWWRKYGSDVDLTALDQNPRMMGYTVVAEYTDGRNGRVSELGPHGRVRWKVDNIPWPLDVQVLPGQRLLLSEFYDNRVAERNLRGELLWHKQLTQAPLTARRLSNGNTLIVTQNQILEVDRAGREIQNINRPGVLAAERLRSGLMASIDSAGGFTVFDAAGKPVKSFSVGAFQSYSSFEVLPNGGVIVPLTGQNLIAEFNAQGKRVWEANAQRPTSAVRLPNGHTLVSCRDFQLVVELDKSGRQVWQYKSGGYPWRAYRR